ncbi:MAG: hypothetical protein K2X66_00760, partial [Cyanobacteria bacterium]|nr:hypothetical protein [Cyanobacteriota bacterium]
MNPEGFETSQETISAQESHASLSQEEELPLFEFYHQTIQQLDQTVSELQQEFSAFMQCKKGCSGCCIDGFRIRYIEAVHILNGFATMSPEDAKLILDRLFPENLQSEENKEAL